MPKKAAKSVKGDSQQNQSGVCRWFGRNFYLLAIFAVIALLVLGTIATAIATTFRAAETLTWTQIVHNDITFHLGDTYETGVFATGEPYVVAPPNLPVRLHKLLPSYTTRQARAVHGAMLNPECGTQRQGFDSGIPNNEYDSSLNIARRLSLGERIELWPGDRLVGSISNIAPEGQHPSMIEVVAVLVVLPEHPPTQGYFRPGYCYVAPANESDKIYNEDWHVDALDLSSLSSITVPQGEIEAGTVTIPEVEDVFRFVQTLPWFDYICDWPARSIHPSRNMPMGAYYREIAGAVSVTAMMLQMGESHISVADKRQMAIYFTQIGIDWWYKATCGGRKYGCGCRMKAGRKFPILFAGQVLNEPRFLEVGARSGDYMYGRGGLCPNPPPDDFVLFDEDEETFYVNQWDIDVQSTSTWVPDDRSEHIWPYDATHLNMPEWQLSRVTPYSVQGNFYWGTIYRRCCKALSWNGQILAARLMGLQSAWNHDAMFDYIDRYMEISRGNTDPFGFPMPYLPGMEDDVLGWRSAVRPFIAEIYDYMRDNGMIPGV